MEESKNTSTENSGIIYGNIGVGETTYEMNKFHGSQGHGFAAERAEHMYDTVHGDDAQILGDNNAKNGADRLVNGVEIQSKYCRSGSACIQACFEDGKYRYISANGEPMQVEVPADMYDDAVEAMRRRIANHEVDGITDPEEAKRLVRKGHYTYEQAKQIAKAGTIESLSFDAVNGVVIGANAMGITAMITFATSVWNGDGVDTALENAALSGIKVGGVAFLTTVITSQITRTAIHTSVRQGTDFILKKLGTRATSCLANSFRNGTNIYGAAAMNNVSKLLTGNIIASSVSMAILSIGDIIDLFRCRISGGQFIKNTATTGATIVGGNVGWTAGNVIGGTVGGTIGGVLTGGTGAVAGAKIGSKIGGIAGSVAGGAAAGNVTHSVMDAAIEDDSLKIMREIEREYTDICEEYLLTENEVYETLDSLKDDLSAKKIKDIYSSDNRQMEIRTLIMQCVEPVIAKRKYIYERDMDDILTGVRNVIEDAMDGTGVFDTSELIPSLPDVRETLVTERNVREDQIPGIMQTVLQINRTQQRAERALLSMKRSNEDTELQRQELRNERDRIKQEIETMLDKWN